MSNNNNLTTGKIGKTLILFALPYLLSCFMQTFYGMVDLFVVGQYNGSATTNAVSIGSQVIHMLTVIIIGFAMGTTVRIGRAVGAKNEYEVSKTVGNTIVFFTVFAIISTIVLVCLTGQIADVMNTPKEALKETNTYLKICFAGIPFIVAYNVISSIFRGAGDSKRPMYFVAVSCVVNIVLDYVFIGGFKMGAAGAALGTICGQAVSVIVAAFFMIRADLGFKVKKSDIKYDGRVMKNILGVGAPIALQDGLIQVAFIVITIIANSRGLTDATGVGIVEKLISFMFLVPSAFLSAISAVVAQNVGAGKRDRARQALRIGLIITFVYGILCFVFNQFYPDVLVGLFTKDSAVLKAGCDYMKSYSADVALAGIHFCFSGYFCGDQKSVLSFIHNIASIIIVRIPGAYLASKMFPDSLYPMGLAAPLGSLLSAIICVVFYVIISKRKRVEKAT